MADFLKISLKDGLAAKNREYCNRRSRERGIPALGTYLCGLFQVAGFKADARSMARVEALHDSWWSMYADAIPERTEEDRAYHRNPALFVSCLLVAWRERRKAARRRDRSNPASREHVARKLRRKMQRAIKDGKGLKSGASRDIIGADWGTVKSHLEAQFQPGMSWLNHGQYGWHIDHIIPLARFDLRIPEQVKQAWHYTNLQPLWWHENLAKSDKPAA